MLSRGRVWGARLTLKCEAKRLALHGTWQFRPSYGSGPAETGVAWNTVPQIIGIISHTPLTVFSNYVISFNPDSNPERLIRQGIIIVAKGLGQSPRCYLESGRNFRKCFLVRGG